MSGEKAGPQRWAESASEPAGPGAGPGAPVRAAGLLLEAVFAAGARARRRGWRLRGAVEVSWEVARCLSAVLSTPDTQLHPRGRHARPQPWGARGWGRGSRAAVGGQPEGSALRPVRSRHPATAGRSLRARGAPRGAAILTSSLRTRGGLGGRPAGLGVRTSQVQGVTRAGSEGRGGGDCGACPYTLAMALISPEVQGR